MAYTQEQLTALETALAKGEKRVTFGDKTRRVPHGRGTAGGHSRRSKRDLHDQAVATGLWPRAPRQIRVTTGKGF